MATAYSSARERSYQGPDRRHHRVFVTKNSEYHCRDAICVAVKDLRTGQFMNHHAALGRKLSGAIKFKRDGSIEGISTGLDARVGQQLCFAAGTMGEPKDVITSPLLEVARPPKDVVAHYPS